MSGNFGSIDRLPSRKDTARKKVGKWRARYTAPNGQRPTKTFATKLDAQWWLASEKKLIDLGTWQPLATRKQQQQQAKERDRLTVGVCVTDWLERRRSGLKVSTSQLYDRTIRSRITGVADAPAVAKLANTPLHELDKTAVHEWWDSMNKAFKTPSTNRRAYIYLRAAVEEAVDRDLIPSNPVNVKAARKKPKTKEKELPTVETMRALVDHLPDRYKLLGVLCLFMGLRIGEALALKRGHLVNIGTEESPQWEVRVRGNLQRVTDTDGRTVMLWQEPKTEASARNVPIFPDFNGIVEAHLKGYAPNSDDEYLTTTAKGQPVMDTSFRSVLERAREKAGVTQKITPHYGRNWLNTYMAEEGATPAEIGSVMGQEDLKTITETYMKFRPDNLNSVLGRVGNRISNQGGAVVSLDEHKKKRA